MTAIGEENSAAIITDVETIDAKEKLVGLYEEKDLRKDDQPEVIGKDEDAQKSMVSPEVVEKLSKGLLDQFVGDIKQMQTSLSDLTRNQTLVIETIQQENARFEEIQEMYNLDDMFQRAKLYHTKLIKLKKDMASLHERSIKLKKRALRLQQQKQKEALQREQQKERELEREKQLLAKVATKPQA